MRSTACCKTTSALSSSGDEPAVLFICHTCMGIFSTPHSELITTTIALVGMDVISDSNSAKATLPICYCVFGVTTA